MRSASIQAVVVCVLGALLIGAAPARVLGPEVQGSFAAVLSQINQDWALGPGIQATGISVEPTQATLSLQGLPGATSCSVVLTALTPGVSPHAQWLSIRLDPSCRPTPDLVDRLIGVLDRSFSRDPYRTAESDRSDRPPGASWSLVHNDQQPSRANSLRYVATVAALILLASVLGLWRLLRETPAQRRRER